MKDYRAPRWLHARGSVGGHLQTIWPALFSRRFQGPAPVYRRERWTTPDGDFIDVDHATHDSAPGAPVLVLFHGLEGSSDSAYAVAFADWAREQRLAYAVPHFRGCSGELNRAPRAYHSGDFVEIDWILKRFRAHFPDRPLLAVGVSLGGNALLRWAGEMGHTATATAQAVAAVCSPLDLAAGGHAIGQHHHGFQSGLACRDVRGAAGSDRRCHLTRAARNQPGKRTVEREGQIHLAVDELGQDHRRDDAERGMFDDGQAVVATKNLARHELDARHFFTQHFEFFDLV